MTDSSNQNLLARLNALGESLKDKPLPPLAPFPSAPAAFVPASVAPVAGKVMPLLEQRLADAWIDPADEIMAPPVCLQVNDNGIPANVCTLGNFSLATGKAKSRKSFFTALTFSIVTGYDHERFTGTLPPDRNMGIYFDTEQSKYHVQKLLQRICRLVNKPAPANIKVYSLRKYTPAERLETIEYALYNNDKVGFVVIDGIRDLVTSINDEEQATLIAAKLLRWTEERNIHIMAVLHQNKGDNNARGHLSAELTNKAETVLSIAKDEQDRNMSVVEAAYCRDREFNPFAFTIDIEGLPEITADWQKTNKIKDPQENISDTNMFSMLSRIFSVTPELSYTELQSQIKVAYKNLHRKELGTNRIKEIISQCKQNKWVIQDTGWRSPYLIGKFNNEV